MSAFIQSTFGQTKRIEAFGWISQIASDCGHDVNTKEVENSVNSEKLGTRPSRMQFNIDYFATICGIKRKPYVDHIAFGWGHLIFYAYELWRFWSEAKLYRYYMCVVTRFTSFVPNSLKGRRPISNHQCELCAFAFGYHQIMELLNRNWGLLNFLSYCSLQQIQ